LFGEKHVEKNSQKLQEEMARLRIPCKNFFVCLVPLAMATAAEKKSSFCVAGIEWSRSNSFATALGNLIAPRTAIDYPPPLSITSLE